MSETMLTRDKIAALRKLLDAATKGPWIQSESDPWCLHGETGTRNEATFAEFDTVWRFDGIQDEDNAACTAALHNAATDLLGAAEKAIRLEEYVQHHTSCPCWDEVLYDGVPRAVCTCGLDKALKGGDDV